jgi:6-pyruvoyltetrahydropterin/6-carboxytetrahydropterin synthase
MMEIFRGFTFEAAHRLPNVLDGHKCARLHGHSFRVDIYLAGPVNEHSGWIVDFSDIKKAFEQVHNTLDHQYLNEIEGLENPTSENIARWIWQAIAPALPLLSKVVLHETCASGVVYRGGT